MRLCSSPRASNRAGGRCGERICRSAGHSYGESDGKRAGGGAHRADAGVSPRPFVAEFGILPGRTYLGRLLQL